MSTSGSVDFNLTRNQIITNALSLLRVVGAEDTVTSYDMSTGNQFLNMMIKMWQADGVGIWTRTEATLFITNGQATYTLGGSSSDRVADVSKSVLTTTSAAAASSATTVTCTTVTGMSASDAFGIVLDSGAIQWTTIVSINTGTKVVTITDALTGAAASGNNVYTYSTKIFRPHDITQIRYRFGEGGPDRILYPMSREDYFNLTNKAVTGPATRYYYDSQLNDAVLYLYPIPTEVKDTLRITYNRGVEDFDNPGDNPDFPQEFLLALSYNLALCMAPLYGKEFMIQQGLGQLAGQYYMMAKQFDIDAGPIYLVPDKTQEP